MRLPDELVEQVQKFADDRCWGNRSLAMRELLNRGLKQNETARKWAQAEKGEMKLVTLRGGDFDMDGTRFPVANDCLSIFAVHEYEPGWFRKVLYTQQGNDPAVWDMGPYVEEESD
jgi:hypothetical protein